MRFGSLFLTAALCGLHLLSSSKLALAHGDHSGRQGNMLEALTAYTPGHEVELLLSLNFNGFETLKLGSGKGPALYLARFRAGGGLAPAELAADDHHGHEHGEGALAGMGHLEVELTPIAVEKLPELWSTRLGLFFLTTGLYRDLHLGKEWDLNMRALGVRAMRDVPTIGELEMMVTLLADAIGFRKRQIADSETFEGAHLASANLEVAQQLVLTEGFTLALAAGAGGAVSYGAVGGETTPLYDWTTYGELRGDGEALKRLQFFLRAEYEQSSIPAMMQVYSNLEIMAGIRLMLARK